MTGGNWQADAACRYADPALFDQPDGVASRVPEAARIAASYCEICPVVNECDAYADEHQVRGMRAKRWRYFTKHGYDTSPVTPLTTRAIPVILHPVTPERAAS